jgi:Family of unknown function (DUF6065)
MTDVSEKSNVPLITVHCLYKDAPVPKPADRTINGTIPARAKSFCEPFMTMNGLGLLIYPPVDFALMWDGEQIFWRPGTDSTWRQLVDGVAPPGFDEEFFSNAPPHVTDLRPFRFLEKIPENGMVQIWPGILVRTRPGYGMVVRSPINQLTPGIQFLEGFIETDWWFGPLAAPARILKTDVPIVFSTNKPFLQIYAFPKDVSHAQSEQTVGRMGMEAMTVEDWESYDAAVAPLNRRGETGAYFKRVKHDRRGGRAESESE